MTLTCISFENGQPIPIEHSCKGTDSSPALSWSGVPKNTVSFALICDDPDAPIGTWIHWVYFNIPSELTALPAAVPAGDKPEIGGIQGRNSWRKNSYGGPCPPSGTHRYFFKLYALDAFLDLGPSANKKKVLDTIEGHVLAQAELMGTFAKR